MLNEYLSKVTPSSKSVSETFHLSVKLCRENAKNFRSIKTTLKNSIKLAGNHCEKNKDAFKFLSISTEASLFVKSVLRLCAGLLNWYTQFVHQKPQQFNYSALNQSTYLCLYGKTSQSRIDDVELVH